MELLKIYTNNPMNSFRTVSGGGSGFGNASEHISESFPLIAQLRN